MEDFSSKWGLLEAQVSPGPSTQRRPRYEGGLRSTVLKSKSSVLIIGLPPLPRASPVVCHCPHLWIVNIQVPEKLTPKRQER